MSFLVFYKNIKKLTTDIILIILGFVFLFLVIPILLLISSPFCLYRFLISKVISPCFQRDIGKPVTTLGTPTATEFLSHKQATRCANVLNFVLQGSIAFDEVMKIVDQNWIKSRLPNGDLKYPEFQQYIEHWMGYMFCKQDKEFDLKNHLKLHVLSDDTNSNKFASNIIEDLLNNPFPVKRSPWEMHIIHNYKDPELADPNETLTMVVFRVHHALADGFAVMYAVVEGLFEISLQEVQTVASSVTVERNSSFTIWRFINFCKFPFQILHEAGSYVTIFFTERTPWHVEDRDKTWRQMQARSYLIPIKKLKDIKNKLNVSLTATLLSCVSAGTAKTISKKSGVYANFSAKNMLFGFAIPLPGHPRTLRNHITGATLNACTELNVHPLERLMVMNARYNAAKNSILPKLFLQILKVIGCYPAPIAQLILKNTMVAVGISNFPGPEVILNLKGRKVLRTDFVAGILPGVAGVGFQVLSYNNHIRIGVVAEGAVMTRKEQGQLVEHICSEINTLYELSNHCEHKLEKLRNNGTRSRIDKTL